MRFWDGASLLATCCDTLNITTFIINQFFLYTRDICPAAYYMSAHSVLLGLWPVLGHVQMHLQSVTLVDRWNLACTIG